MAVRYSTGLRNLLGGINTEKVTNGGFESDTSGWSASNATLSSVGSGQSGNALRVTETGGASPGQAYQDVTVKVGHVYRFTVYHKLGTAAAGKIKLGTTGTPAAYYDSGAVSDAAWTQKTVYFVPTNATLRITLESTDATVGEYTDFDTATLVNLSRSFQDIFKNGEVRIYSGTMPASADNPPGASNTLLVTIKKNGTDGVSFDDAVAGVLSKAAAETWQGTVVVDGTAAWARLQQTGDLGTDNAVDARIDMSVGTFSGEIQVPSTAFLTGAVQTLTKFTITVPEA